MALSVRLSLFLLASIFFLQDYSRLETKQPHSRMTSSFRGHKNQSFHTGISKCTVTQPHNGNFQENKLKSVSVKTTAPPQTLTSWVKTLALLTPPGRFRSQGRCQCIHYRPVTPSFWHADCPVRDCGLLYPHATPEIWVLTHAFQAAVCTTCSQWRGTSAHGPWVSLPKLDS